MHALFKKAECLMTHSIPQQAQFFRGPVWHSLVKTFQKTCLWGGAGAGVLHDSGRAQGGRWRAALDLFRQFCAQGGRPNTATYNALVGFCHHAPLQAPLPSPEVH